MSMFALGWKGWVELREARRVPRLMASEVKHPLSTGRTITLKQLCFKGGSFLASLPRRQFTAITRLSCPTGSVVRVAAPLAAKLLKKVNYEYEAHSAAAEAALEGSTATA